MFRSARLAMASAAMMVGLAASGCNSPEPESDFDPSKYAQDAQSIPPGEQRSEVSPLAPKGAQQSATAEEGEEGY
jgi:hypothetical protein